MKQKQKALNISLLLLPYERIKIMHSNLSLSLVNVAEASPRRYLEKQLQSLEDSFRLRSNSKEVKYDLPFLVVQRVDDI